MATAVEHRPESATVLVERELLVDRIVGAAADSRQWPALAGMLRAVTSSLLDAVLSLRHEPIESFAEPLAFAADRIATRVGDAPIHADPRYVLGRIDALLDLSDMGIDRSVSTVVVTQVRERAHVLSILCHLVHEGETRASDLADAVGIKRNYLSNILRWMEDEDLVRRATLGRTTLVALGSKGEAVYLELTREDQEFDRDSAALGERLLQQLLAVMSTPELLIRVLPTLQLDGLRSDLTWVLREHLEATLERFEILPAAAFEEPAADRIAQDAQTPRDRFINGLSAALSAEQMTLDLLSNLQQQTRAPEVWQVLQQHEFETRQQVQNLRQVFRTMCAASNDAVNAGAVERGEGQVERSLPSVTEMASLGGAVKTKPYEMAMYRGLLQMADGLGEDEAAQLLQQNLRQDMAMVQRVQGLTERMGEELQTALAGDPTQHDRNHAVALSSGGPSRLRSLSVAEG